MELSQRVGQEHASEGRCIAQRGFVQAFGLSKSCNSLDMGEFRVAFVIDLLQDLV